MFESDEKYHGYRRMETIVGFCLIIILIGIIKTSQSGGSDKEYKSYPGGGNELVMYSLTTCGYCTQKREELQRERVRFTEYFIDKDRVKDEEMMAKLRASGDTRNYITVPVFDVYGYMITNNPSVEVLKEHIDKYMPKVNESTGLTEYNG